MQSPTKNAAFAGVLAALALIFGYVESLVPLFITMPGIKLGLANLVVLFALYKLGWKWAALVNVCRMLLSALLFTNAFTLLYSLFGAAFAFAAMLAAKRSKLFSPCGVSIAGGAAHNVGQMAACLLFTQTQAILHYTPVLVISGALFGAITGLVANLVLKRLR